MHLAVDQVMHKWQRKDIAAALIQSLGFDGIDAFEQGMQLALGQRTQRRFENTVTTAASSISFPLAKSFPLVSESIVLSKNIAPSKNTASSKHSISALAMDDPHHYLIELSSKAPALAEIFAPFIAAALNQKTVYIAAAHQRTEQIYAQYFKLAALAQHRAHALAQMYLDVDLVDLGSIELSQCAQENQENQQQSLQQDCAVQQQHLLHYALARACLDPACETIYLRGDVYLSQQDIDDFYTVHAIQLHCLKPSVAVAAKDSPQQDQVDFKRLFCKVKTQDAAQVCQQMAKVNAAFISQITQLDLTQSEQFIDDLLYSEHVFEKLSVFSEFTETLVARQLTA